MALITVHLGMVSPQGRDDVPFPASGRVEFVPAAHGKYDGAFRTIETINAPIVQGVMQPVEITPGPWRVTVNPTKGNPWPTQTFIIEEGMGEPLNLVDLAPDIIVDGKEYARGPVGPVGPGIEGGYADADDNLVLVLDNGVTVEPIPLPRGPQGIQGPTGPKGDRGDRGPEGPNGPKGNTGPQGPQGDKGDKGDTGDEGPQGPKGDKGDEGPASTVPGPANNLTVGTVTTGAADSNAEVTVTGSSPNQSVNFTIPRGAQGAKGDPGNLGSTIIYGAGRPDVESSMTTETAASVASAQSGAQFISTDGAGVGAWTWQKLGTTWTVTVGDTGWRLLRGSEILPEWQGASFGGTGSGNHNIRRVGTTIHWLTYWYQNQATNGRFGDLPSGFQLPNTVPGGGYGTQEVGRSGSTLLQIQNGTRLVVQGKTTGEIRIGASWVTAQAWPSTLPGSAG